MPHIRQDLKEIEPFELKANVIKECYLTASNCLVIEFAGGKRVRIFAEGGHDSTIQIRKYP